MLLLLMMGGKVMWCLHCDELKPLCRGYLYYHHFLFSTMSINAEVVNTNAFQHANKWGLVIGSKVCIASMSFHTIIHLALSIVHAHRANTILLRNVINYIESSYTNKHYETTGT